MPDEKTIIKSIEEAHNINVSIAEFALKDSPHSKAIYEVLKGTIDEILKDLGVNEEDPDQRLIKMMANEIEICELMSEAKPLMSGFLIMQRGIPVAHLSHPYMSEGRKMVCKVIRFDKDSEGVSKGIIVPDPIRL
ncbi:MAG: hypothetical protein ABFD82_18450 [Syntrophaceae bacterium]|jgi:hypothetical protein